MHAVGSSAAISVSSSRSSCLDFERACVAVLARALGELAWILRQQGRKSEAASVRERLEALLESRGKLPEPSSDVNLGLSFRIAHLAFRPD